MQMGYMFRYQNGFRQISEWVHSGLLGDIYCARAHMSTGVPMPPDGRIIAVHQGGIFFDLAGHMLDQIVWLMGRPTRTTAFFPHGTADDADPDSWTTRSASLNSKNGSRLRRHCGDGAEANGPPL